MGLRSSAEIEGCVSRDCVSGIEQQEAESQYDAAECLCRPWYPLCGSLSCVSAH